MNTLAEQFYREARQLPEHLACEVYDFIRFLEQRHGIASAAEPAVSGWTDFFNRHGKTVQDTTPLSREELYADRLR